VGAGHCDGGGSECSEYKLLIELKLCELVTSEERKRFW
jgi:hypothetical protein